MDLLGAKSCGTTNPLGFGPAFCPGKTIVRPREDACDNHKLSPFLDECGRYRGDMDRPNALEVAADVLQLCAAHVIDNGEGKGWPHGPYGNLYWDMFNPDEPLQQSRDGAHKRRITSPHTLRGPHRTHGTTDEWLDDELLTYHAFGLFRWGTTAATGSQVVLRVWESDSQSEDGNWLGRRNDVLGMELVDRAATEAANGVWVDLHRYTNSHPRRRTGKVAIQMLLKTGGDCP